jgi:hypothetical protein
VAKLRIKASSLRWLIAIDDFVRRFDYRGSYFAHVASDTLDGWAIKSELRPLVRAKVLEFVPCDEPIPDRGEDMCGNYFSVHLTKRAIDTFWPGRDREQRRRRPRRASITTSPPGDTQ